MKSLRFEALRLAPKVRKQIREIAHWYRTQEQHLERRFLSELKSTLQRIEQHPEIAPMLEAPTRRVLMSRFPYGVYYTIEGSTVIVGSIAHLHRHPEAWKGK